MTPAALGTKLGAQPCQGHLAEDAATLAIPLPPLLLEMGPDPCGLPQDLSLLGVSVEGGKK